MDFNTSRIPSKISPCPIHEAVFELRFDSDFSSEVIPGLLYNELKDDFPEIKKLPIMEMPQVIRDNEPNLQFAAHHVFTGQNFRFQVGPRSFSLVCPKEYVGWTQFKEKISFIFTAIDKIKLVKRPIRTGLRYINFFENEDIFNHVKVILSIDGNSLIGSQNLLRSEFEHNSFRCLLNINNQSKLKDIPGSTIDIDVIKNTSTTEDVDYTQIIYESHEVEKKYFLVS